MPIRFRPMAIYLHVIITSSLVYILFLGDCILIGEPFVGLLSKPVVEINLTRFIKNMRLESSDSMPS